MESQQMMELLLAMQEDMKTNQEKAEANRKTDKEERKAAQVKADADQVQMQEMMMMHTYQAKTYAILPAMQVMETSHKEIVAESKPKTDIKTTACQEMQARQDEAEPTSVEMKPEVAQQQEVPKEVTVVQLVKGQKRRLRGRSKLQGDAESRRN
jgi:hypothetical protein